MIKPRLYVEPIQLYGGIHSTFSGVAILSLVSTSCWDVRQGRSWNDWVNTNHTMGRWPTANIILLYSIQFGQLGFGIILFITVVFSRTCSVLNGPNMWCHHYFWTYVKLAGALWFFHGLSMDRWRTQKQVFSFPHLRWSIWSQLVRQWSTPGCLLRLDWCFIGVPSSWISHLVYMKNRDEGIIFLHAS